MNNYEQVLIQFINSNQRNTWLNFPLMKVYVRKGTHLVNRLTTKTLDIASVEVDHQFQNQGIFSIFLTAAERVAKNAHLILYVENILDPRFVDFFKKRGYDTMITDGGDTIATKQI